MLNEVYLVRMNSFLLHLYLHTFYIRLSTILLLSLKYRIDLKYTVLFVVSKYCHSQACENLPRGPTQHKRLKGIKELHLARRGVNRARSNVLLKANLCSSNLGLDNRKTVKVSSMRFQREPDPSIVVEHRGISSKCSGIAMNKIEQGLSRLQLSYRWRLLRRKDV